ncbi:zf-HC2 domain-containing protein [Thiocapsa sp.]|uniref:zf-HC2 domain-containing protein n=1 Tax=Thiocapsa sp. TaxID=2024551 RepID=UPI0035933601
MMNCKEATELMSEDLDRPLRWRERVALRFHLMMCGGCRNFKDQIGFLRAAIRQRSGRD